MWLAMCKFKYDESAIVRKFDSFLLELQEV